MNLQEVYRNWLPKLLQRQTRLNNGRLVARALKKLIMPTIIFRFKFSAMNMNPMYLTWKIRWLCCALRLNAKLLRLIIEQKRMPIRRLKFHDWKKN